LKAFNNLNIPTQDQNVPFETTISLFEATDARKTASSFEFVLYEDTNLKPTFQSKIHGKTQSDQFTSSKCFYFQTTVVKTSMSEDLIIWSHCNARTFGRKKSLSENKDCS